MQADHYSELKQKHTPKKNKNLNLTTQLCCKVHSRNQFQHNNNNNECISAFQLEKQNKTEKTIVRERERERKGSRGKWKNQPTNQPHHRKKDTQDIHCSCLYVCVCFGAALSASLYSR